jgi:hypothetical protein
MEIRNYRAEIKVRGSCWRQNAGIIIEASQTIREIIDPFMGKPTRPEGGDHR